MIADETNNPVIQQLTPQVKVALEKTLAPPEEQVDKEMKGKLVELAKYISTL